MKKFFCDMCGVELFWISNNDGTLGNTDGYSTLDPETMTFKDLCYSCRSRILLNSSIYNEKEIITKTTNLFKVKEFEDLFK